MPRPSPIRRLAGVLALGACAPADVPRTAAVVRDSAGIRIVESRAAAWSTDDALVVPAGPSLVIGDEDGGAEDRFGWVAAGARLSDGRIAVFDAMADELRYYDRRGRFVARTGGPGGGPGEYRAVTWMRRLAGDSLVLHDMMAQRLTVLTPDGTVARTVSVATASAGRAATPAVPTLRDGRVVMPRSDRHRPVGVFDDGSLLAIADPSPPPADGRVARDTVAYVRLAPDGTVRDTIGRFPGDELQMTTEIGARGAFRVSIGSPPFARSTHVAVDDDGFWVGTADRFEIGRYDTAGRLVRLVRRPVAPPRVTDADVASGKRRDVGNTPASGGAGAGLRRAVEARWQRAAIPTTMPAHGPLEVGGGRLWVRETAPPDAAGSRWVAFRSDGVMLGSVVLPARFRVLEFGADHVLGVRRDDLDVQQVELYALRRGGDAAHRAVERRP
jgi:hypothetical protein